MQRVKHKKFMRVVGFFFVAVLLFAAVWGSLMAAPTAYAASGLNIDSTNVLDDLNGSTIGGKEFNLADYPYDENSKTQVISFSEYCYSYYSKNQGNYGLYVYVYNPQGKAFDERTERNKIYSFRLTAASRTTNTSCSS